ncbi:complement C1q and tumor necrosis factor-related protein 9A-like [Saccostrea echinata]|uniref:complement C1q and tumor necrosis factor-related protein 9A-like n=1 Tax=Saccostrea echinata TaxID=191078 RepID=UPI002A7F7BDA|nr:complement C1q and tumor necrosis factor-related protein 9A-like [Saccostrea echinata]
MLEQRVQGLEAMNNTLAKLIQQTVGFTACLSSPSAVNIGYQQPIKFNHVITNDGNGFDPRHGTFRAPVSGLYHFSMTIYSVKSHPIRIQMVKDGTELIRTYEGGSDYLSSTTDVNVRLSAGQTVWCRNSQTANALINFGGYSCFSGHQISS